MYILSGKFKGRRLGFPKGKVLRPTTGLVRKAFFDLVAPKIVGSCFLDLYAGTGAVGIEALSRGAEKVVFVENDRKVVPYLEQNIQAFQSQYPSPESSIILYRKSVEKALGLLARDGHQFDLIFADPPYTFTEERLIRLIIESLSHKLLKPGGIFILQHRSGLEKNPIFQQGLALLPLTRDTRRYGDTSLSLLHSPRT